MVPKSLAGFACGTPKPGLGLSWLTGNPTYFGGSDKAITNEVGVGVKSADNFLAIGSGASLIPQPTSRGTALRARTKTDSYGVYYTASNAGWLAGSSQLTMMVWFLFQASPDNNGQQQIFRLDNQHTLDIFGVTSNTIWWGADWAGAWNGGSQQVSTNLVDNSVVCIAASITGSGARFFINGHLSGTKSGSAFTISTGTAGVVKVLDFPIFGIAAFRRALSDNEMKAYTLNPRALWVPKRTWIPVAAAATTFIPSWARQNSRVIGGGV